MFDTEVTIVGNVLSEPEWRRTTNTGTYVMTFRLASTSRRYDKAGTRWVDGDSLRLKVVCWRQLGQNVMASINLGEPLIVKGRLYSRDWTDEEQKRHTSYELEATSVGHDLSKGVSRFARRRLVASDQVVDPAQDPSVAGEPSEPSGPPDAPADLETARALLGDFDPELFASPGDDPVDDPDDDSDDDSDDEATAEVELAVPV